MKEIKIKKNIKLFEQQQFFIIESSEFRLRTFDVHKIMSPDPVI